MTSRPLRTATMLGASLALAATTLLTGAGPASAAPPAAPAGDVAPMARACTTLYARHGDERASICKTWYKHEGESTYHGSYSGTLHGASHGAVLQASVDGRVIPVRRAKAGQSVSFSGRYERTKRLLFRVCRPAGVGGAVRHCGGWW